jgi:hypothetical protein
VVLLTNLYAANLLAAARQKVFELLFGGEFESWASPLSIEEQPSGRPLVALVGHGLIHA